MAASAAHFDKVSGSVPVAAGPDVMLQFQDSTYGAGTAAAAGPGRIGTSSQPPRNVDDSFSTPGPGGGPSAAPPPSSRWGLLTIGYYRPYFDVDTIDVLERIRDSLFPFPRSNFLEKTSLNPDMYGPFWICTTLIFVTAALGNLSAYLSHATTSASDDPSVWYYDINKVSWAAAIFYGYTAVVPAALYFLLRYLGVSSGLVQLWCLYGYSLFVFIPTSFVSVVPLEFVRWLVVAVATVVSATFLGTNLKTQIAVGMDKWILLVTGAVALQCLLGLILKLYFFTYFGSTSKN
eukprot:TRINITY_DN13691_c0_g1_i1.p1 TRINITY_DN13691_c0_g1~~TRINITY_DN13691_c0_g1_i1.p1  ORF type:complete len:291 (-),score=65.43 TRINITY_DN13691_c0_g1_i1:343-1215(-)